MKIVKQLLLEGAYDKITTDASRIIVNLIKAGETEGSIDLELKSNAPVDFMDMKVEIPIYVNINVIIEYVDGTPGGYDAVGFADTDEIEIQLTIDPNKLPHLYSALIPTIKEAVRHELEHVAQLNGLRPEAEEFEKYEIELSDLRDTKKELTDYFLLRHEIPAFVRGLYKAAKTRKKPLDVVIDNFLEDYAHRMSDVNKVRRAWINYAKRNLPAAQWSK